MTKKDKDIRKAVQNSIFTIMIFLTLFMITGSINSAHQFCPYSAICFGAMYPRSIITYTVTVILSFLVLLATVFIGRKFCSYICFLGTIQEKLYTIFKWKKNIKIHPRLHKILSWLKYIILFSTIARVVLLVQYEYFKACPVLSISFISRIALKGIIVLALIIILGLFIERFWCRYMCPYGALMNIFQFIGGKFGIKRLKVKRNITKSLGCKNCSNYCPMGIEINDDDIINDASCIHCLKCVRICLKTNKSKDGCIC